MLDAIATRAVKELAGAVVDGGQPAFTADEVRAVVRDDAARYLRTVESLHPSASEHIAEQIADRVAEKLARRAVDHAQRETDLLEAFVAGYDHAADIAEISEHNGWHRTDPHIVWPSLDKRDAAAAEYAHSKVNT